jgi:RNA polymerase sigma factor (sigma-70 family)
VQEALLAAATQWPTDGVPDNPRAWLVAVARRRLVDEWRSESARRRREEHVALLDGWDQAEPGEVSDHDDTLTLLLLCAHPALSAPSQLALTLRAVGGLTTAEIASAFLVPESTMAQRISRAKQAIKAAGATFTMPSPHERAERVQVVLHVLYLIFNEGYTASSGPTLRRSDLTAEAIRLTRLAGRLLPDDGELSGLLALMLLTDARRRARTAADGSVVPLDQQDRSLWDKAQVGEAVDLLARTVGHVALGPYQVQAAIAALHDEAASDATTDWAQILALYGLLEQISPGPVVTLNRAVALAKVSGPRAGLDLVATLDSDDRMTRTHRVDAVRAHLLEQLGDVEAAVLAYRRAAQVTDSIPERNYLLLQAARLAQRDD